MKLALTSVLVLAAFACGDDSKSSVDAKMSDGNPSADAAPDAPEGTTVLRSTLSGYQEVPPVHAAARGAAVLGVNESRTQITLELAYTDLANITAAHIHHGKPGINGGVLFTLASADFASPLVKTLTEADFTPVGDITTFAQAVDEILAGNTYINVHTMDNMSGAIRGHVGPTTLTAVASGLQENPAVTASSTGTATVTLDAEQDTLTVNLDSDMVTDATGAHIHVGGVGVNGPVIFDLGAFADPLTATLEEAQLAPQAELGIATMRDAVDAVLSGRAYLNVHTTANAGGELRAQLGAVSLRSALTPGQETGNVANPGMSKGRAFLTISGDQTTITTSTQYSGFMQADVTAAHIHVGALGAAPANNVIFALAGANVASPIAKVLTMADFTPNAGVTTFPAAINALLTGNTYINIHTTQNAAGQVRGQVGRAVLTAALDGLSEVPPVVTAASGTATLTLHGEQRSLTVAGTHQNLASITSAHLHLGGPTVAGPVLFPLADATFPSPFTFVVTSDQLTAQPGAMNMFEAVGQILDENTYLNIHTTQNPGGEIRGQLRAP